MEVRRFSINESLARTAKNMNSFHDYESGSATAEYSSYIKEFEDAVNDLLTAAQNRLFPPTEEDLQRVNYYCERYSSALAGAINKYNGIEARCPSIMICGGGNFPVAKKQKQNAARDRFWQENNDLYNPTGNRYFKKIRNILTNNAVKDGDKNAIEKLKAKLADLEDKHEYRLQINAYYRKNKSVKGFAGISDDQAAVMDKAILESLYKVPVPTYSLAYDTTDIRKLKDRIERLEKAKETADTAGEGYNAPEGIKVVENGEEMRIQLIFDGKPNEETRSILKHNGFRWSPRFGAWQRNLNGNGKYAVKTVLEKLQGKEIF